MSVQTLHRDSGAHPRGFEFGGLPDGGDPGYMQMHDFVEVHGSVSEVTLTVPTGPLARPEVATLYNGLGSFKKTMGGLAIEMALQGNATLHGEPIRGSNRSPLEDLLDATRLHLDTSVAYFDLLASWKAVNDLPHGYELSRTKRNNVGQSYGADVAVRDAEEHPDEVTNIVLDKPVGLEIAHLLRHAKRVPGFMRHELFPFLLRHGPNFGIQDASSAWEHVAGDPLQTLGEIYACARSDNRRRLPGLTVQGVGIAILPGVGDHLTPARPIEKHAKHLADYFKVIPTNHLGAQQYPEIEAYWIADALDYLDNRHKPDLTIHHGLDLTAS